MILKKDFQKRKTDSEGFKLPILGLYHNTDHAYQSIINLEFQTIIYHDLVKDTTSFKTWSTSAHLQWKSNTKKQLQAFAMQLFLTCL